MTEHEHQCLLFEWARLNQKKHPALELLHAIPNGGKRHITVAKKLKKEGVKAGIPDIFLPLPANGLHGLYIELKTEKGKVSPLQNWWIEKLTKQGYQVNVCYGWVSAQVVIQEYLDGLNK